jgi:hypothetical protein
MRKSFTFEHFWSKNATTGHVLLSSVCVSTSPNILRPDLPQALQDLTGVYCRFDATMAISLTRRGPGQWPGLMEGSLPLLRQIPFRTRSRKPECMAQ